jgi:hypothetical protein
MYPPHLDATMLRLTDTQMTTLRELALPVPHKLRSVYLRRVTDLLDGKPFDDGDVWRAAVSAQREILARFGPPDVA